MAWAELGFGKHKGKTLPELVLSDPDWVFWAEQKGALARVPRAGELCANAQRIAVPATARGPRVADYIIHSTGKLSHVEVVHPEDVSRDEDDNVIRLAVFDLSVARQLSPYDKKGGRRIAEAVRLYVFEPRGWERMTKDRCAAFFDDASNFTDQR